jgi:rod shape-determining protein MreC
MLATTSRPRPLVLLVVVVLAQVLLLAIQIKREQDVRLIRVWAVALITPFQRAGTFVLDRAGGAWQGYLALRHAHRQNESLQAELSELKMRVHRLESRAAEADRLGVLLAFRDTHPDAPLLAARVIAASPGGASKTIYLNRGEQDGVRRDMGVITPDGVVGKVLEVYPTTAQVLLLTDRESGVGARLGASRVAGVVRGTGASLALMDYVINDHSVALGDAIVTSGQDKIFPKDLPVGTVTEAAPGNPFKLIRVRPAARLDGLEEVFVLLARDDWKSLPAAETAAKQDRESKAVPR